MTQRALIIYGSGGHGRVVADAAVCAGFQVQGFLDDQKPAGSRVGPWQVLGGEAYLLAHPGAAVVPAVGDNRARRRLCERIEAAGARLTTVVHPRAVLSPHAQLGQGCAILALAVVNSGARVQTGAIINSAAVVEHDVVVGEFAHVSPNASLAGAAALGALAHLGTSACVLPGVRVGEGCRVGAGAVVVRDAAAGSTCVGVPARPRAPQR